MTIQEMRDAFNANLDGQQAILDAAKAEERDLSDDERTSIDDLNAKADALKADIDRVEADRARLERLANRNRQPAARPPSIVVHPTEEAPQAQFADDREFLMAVLRADTGRGIDPRLGSRQAAAGTDEQSEGAAGYGGFLVPTQFVPNLLQITPEGDPIQPTMIPMGSNRVEIPARVDKNHTSSVSGGVTVTRKAETNAAASSLMELEMVVLNAYKLTGLSYVTDELMSDSAISIPALISAAMGDEFTSKKIQERLFGTGVGEFSGVVGHVATVNQAAETNQKAATITADNIIKMRSRCWGYDKAIWLANHDTMPQLFALQMAIGTAGISLYMPSVRDDMPDRLLGRPIHYTEYAKTLGTSGDLVLGNWSEYLEGTMGTVQGAVSAHVRFVNSESTFRFVLRNAGLPWWRSALTPDQSSTTLSPFVTLATRS